MRFKIDGKWKDGFKHDGMLFFAQEIEEMLFYYTNHLYKVPIYNSYCLIQEYLNTCKLVSKDVIKENHLRNILEEFIEAFENDIVFQNSISEEERKYIVQILNSSSSCDRERIMHYLYHEYDDYYDKCVEYLKLIVLEEKEKKKIDRAIRCWLPSLLNAGYSQKFVYKYTCDFWTDNNISSINDLYNYLDSFDFGEKKYRVYVAIKKSAFQFEKILVSRLSAIVEPDEFFDKLRYDKEKYVQISFEVEALDGVKAVQRVYDNLSLFVRFYKFLGNRREEWFFDKCLVRDDSDVCFVADIKPVGYSYAEDYDDKTIGLTSESLITSLINKAHSSFAIIDRVLNIHNVAIENPDMNNSFLNLWSILEIIGISKRDDAKINEVENSILPILINDYAKNVFEELHDYLKANISEGQYKKIITKVKTEKSEYIKIACIVILDEYSELRKELFQALSNYPIIRSRISQLNLLFSKKNIFLKDLNRYEQRVTWNLRRIYRTRNAIIHSGDSPNNMKALGEHLHSYVDEVLYEITVLLAMNTGYCSIDNVVINAKFLNDRIKKNFNIKEKTQYADILLLYNCNEKE